MRKIGKRHRNGKGRQQSATETIMSHMANSLKVHSMTLCASNKDMLQLKDARS
jgi:hypothetical protein